MKASQEKKTTNCESTGKGQALYVSILTHT